MTASVGMVAVAVADAVAVVDALMQVAFSAHTVSAGHEKRASMQRMALGRGEHAYTMPAPVALLMHVCMGAHEMPLPQSFDRKGTADTLQTSIAAMSALMLMVMSMFVVVVLCVVYDGVVIFLLFIIIDNKKTNRVNGDETAPLLTCGTGCLGICATPCDTCARWWSCTCGLTFARSYRCNNGVRLCYSDVFARPQ
jgi:hypothetical protein